VFNGTQQANNEKIVMPVSWQLVNYWTIDGDKSLDIRFDFVGPDGITMNSFENSIQLQEGIKRFRSRTNINGFEVTKSGRYTVVINAKKNGTYEKFSELPVDVNISFNIQTEGGNVAGL
jgi:hypothetical protein